MADAKYVAFSQREERARQVRFLEGIKKDPLASSQIENPHKFDAHLREKKQELEKITPPDVHNDSERARLEARANELAEMIKYGDPKQGFDGMNSIREQEETPVGAVGAELRWNNFIQQWTIDPVTKQIRRVSKDEQGAIFEWKDIQRRLFKDREEEYPDIANVELLRPSDKPGESRFINYRKMSMAPGARMSAEQWNEAVGHEPSEYEQRITALAEDPDVKPRSVDDLYTNANERAGICQAKTASGAGCSRTARPGEKTCGLKKHIEQVTGC